MEDLNAFVKKAKKYLKTAKLLIQEEDYDSSVSRTYYSMFHLATALLKTKGITVSSHKGIHSNFAEQFVKTGIFSKEMSQSLRLAFDDRQAGDYDVADLLERKDAEKLLKKGNQFFQRAMTYLEEHGFKESPNDEKI